MMRAGGVSMPSHRFRGRLFLVLAISLAPIGNIFAQSLADVPAVSPYQKVSDWTLQAVQGGLVELSLQDGQSTTGHLLSFAKDRVTIVDDHQVVLSLPRKEVQRLRLLGAPPPATGPGSLGKPRHYGFSASLLPGLMLDLDYGLVRAYLNGSVVFPAALGGKLWGLSLGVGVGIPVIARAPRFKLDVLALFNVMGVDNACNGCGYDTDYTFGFGLAAGVHYTMLNGFTVGVTAPFIGYSFTTRHHGSVTANTGYYFLTTAVAAPLLFFGYRY